MSDSVWPHRRQPARLRCPWDSPGKNTGMGCHFLLQCKKVTRSPLAVKPLQSCPTLCDPIDGSPPSFPVHGIFQARTLEWAAISFSNAWKWKVKVKSLSRVCPTLAIPWTVVHQAPPSTGFSRQKYWSGVPLPSPIYSHNSLLMLISSQDPFSNFTKQKYYWFESYLCLEIMSK